jgi:4'-phosphopantetheinyl transferase EntD
MVVPTGAAFADGPILDLSAPELHPEDLSALVSAAARRRREYATGRRYARLALGRLGVEPGPLSAGPDRAPTWPRGVTGSISHCENWAVAVVGPSATLGTIGIDVELHRSLPGNVVPLVCSSAEREALARMRPREIAWETVVFSAKESLYKAWHPIAQRWLDFLDVEVRLYPATRCFSARLLRDRETTGQALSCGRFAIDDRHIAASIVLPPRVA